MVVIIIGILASIALPQYLKTTERARAAEALTMLAAIRSSELRFKAMDPGQIYTVTLTALDTEIPTPTVNWAYTVNGTAPGSFAIATRVSGDVTDTISINLDTGNTCTNDTTTYGLDGAC
jgi:Tfp pilus assembly protein PilE